MLALITEARKEYHKYLLENGILTVGQDGIPSNADRASDLSIKIAKGIADRLEAETHEKAIGQTSGAKFEHANMQFLSDTFPMLQNLRPGTWHILKLGNHGKMSAKDFVQYEHLAYLGMLVDQDTKLATCISNDYMVAPDVVIYREPASEAEINNPIVVVDETIANLTEIRERNNQKPILHASISTKWTMRSDRAQNSRTEALGLIRNRKGRVPHIVVITAEPMPSRIASLALGTGDIDCVYHFALRELMDAVNDTGAEDSIEMLKILVEGKRLKDISDLPLDLTV